MNTNAPARNIAIESKLIIANSDLFGGGRYSTVSEDLWRTAEALIMSN